MNNQIKSPRYEVEAGINGCLLIRDTHNSDLTSLTKHALVFLEQHSVHQNLKRTLIVSDIEGNDVVCEMFYANIRQAIKNELVNRVVFIGNELYSHSKLFDIQDKVFFKTTRDFLASDELSTFHNEAILLKITPKFHPQRILSHLQLLAHDTVLEINFDAMFHNIDYFRSKLNTDTKLMCMVKASAYGSGSLEVALAMQYYGVNYLGVAFVHEGVELRQSGIQLPIMVLDPMESSLHHLFRYHLEPEICSFHFLNLIIKEAERHNLLDYPIHIKFDTGMHRAGFEAEDIPQIIATLNSQKAVRVVSAFSHLAAADEQTPEMDAFTRKQIIVFKQYVDELQKGLGYPFLKHILNTAGIERFSEHQFDMVRLGIGLWGVNCVNEHKLRNVCSLTTRIMQLKTVKAGETVGYSRRGKITRESEIALLPLGYADGIDRRLSNGVGSVFYNGMRVPIVGNICMDLLMIDVTGLNVEVGDEVVIFNDDYRFSDMATLLDTIPYEVLTSISPRVRRVYFRE
ncbi:MAG TPA: alanine racemase [Paludibacteraceae bacterium]|nr:alanine racemase [Paludibacteraceae bacterium]HQB69104.1 alanine racemase [Paludibacteraceae bacterium]HRS67534.1 alanine racemase [Paludibacteraceae bacterium]